MLRALALLLLPLILCAKKPVTLDVVTGRARPVGAAAIWSPDGKKFLTRNGTALSVYDVASKSEKRVFDTKALQDAATAPPTGGPFDWENRGVGEKPIQWFPDNSRLLIAERSDLFLVDLANDKWEQLTKTAGREQDPKLSPDARRIAYRLDGNLYTMEIATRKVRQLTRDATATVRNGELDWVYPEELGIETAYWWSPDSRRIAYLQFDTSPVQVYPHADLTQLRPSAEPQRFPQAGTPNSNVRLGIVAATGGETRWPDLPPLEGRLIARVDWLPDSSAVAALLLNRVQNRMNWVILGKDSFRSFLLQQDPAWINVADDYRFLHKSPRLLLGAERPNMRHLYLQPLDGSPAVAVTDGGFEVTSLACVDEEHEWVYFVSSELSPLERNLYRIRFNGSGKQLLTQKRGTHTISMAPGCGHFIDTHSSVTEPPRRALHSSDGTLLAVLRERDTKPAEEYEILPTELVEFRGADSTLFHGRLLKPAGFDPAKKYPAIVQVYGGPHAQSVRNSWRGIDFDQYLAHRGFVVWEMDNRGSAGRGHVWESKLYRRFGKQELEDQVEGVRHLVSMGFVDPARIGINGWSYGGFMTLYSLLNAPDTFHAGISGAPVTDWRQYDTIYTERYLGLPQENETGYKDSSPVHQAANLKGKLMLVHNFEDDNVLFQQTLRMMAALQKAGKQFDFMLYPQRGHGVTGPVRKQMLEGMAQFFERHLRPGSN